VEGDERSPQWYADAFSGGSKGFHRWWRWSWGGVYDFLGSAKLRTWPSRMVLLRPLAPSVASSISSCCVFETSFISLLLLDPIPARPV